MAFQNVSNKSSGGKATGEPVKLTSMKQGDSITGFVLSFVDSLQNPDNKNIFMRSEDGSSTFYVYTAGNVKYLINDGKISEGLLTKITRIADKDVKGKKSSQFEVLQDPDQTVEDVAFNALTPTAEEKVAHQSGATKAAIERASVKAQAQKLTQSMKR
jgi:hypothetical protein